MIIRVKKYTYYYHYLILFGGFKIISYLCSGN